MNFRELADYVAELRQSGFNTIQLRIQYYKKFSTPLFALVLAMIAVPFSFLTGSRGALAGVGVSFGIAIAYWSVNQLFEQIGNINQLPAVAAAWAPNAVLLPGCRLPDDPPANLTQTAGERRQKNPGTLRAGCRNSFFFSATQACPPIILQPGGAVSLSQPQLLYFGCRPTRRGVAQPGRAPGSGPGGPEFKSLRPDHSLTLCRP